MHPIIRPRFRPHRLDLCLLVYVLYTRHQKSLRQAWTREPRLCPVTLMLLVEPESVQDTVVFAGDKLVSQVGTIGKVQTRPAIDAIDGRGNLLWQGIRVLVQAVIVTADAICDVYWGAGILVRLLRLIYKSARSLAREDLALTLVYWP